jgi:uncharacterized protein (TIGR04255 family)
MGNCITSHSTGCKLRCATFAPVSFGVRHTQKSANHVEIKKSEIKMYEKTCYKKSFLKEAILRVDFPSPLPGLDKSLPANISKMALKNFPIAEPQKAHAQEFQFAGADFQAKSSELMRWVFHGKEREKSLIIEPNAVMQTVKTYKTYEVFIEEISEVITEFYKTYKDLTANRVGLRYVNIIEPDDKDPLAWSKYINENILGIIDFHKEKECITRAFHILEYNFDGLGVKYQFGIANPDFPAVVKRKQFVLDIDGYFNGAFEQQEVMDNIEKSHEKIQEIFESSITDNTRTLMKHVKND